MAYDSQTALKAVKTAHPEKQIISMIELPTKFIFEYEATEDEMFFGVALDTYYSVDKSSGEVENYTPAEESDSNTFFNAPHVSIGE